MGEVGGLNHNAGGLRDAAGGEYILQTGKRCADYLFCCPHNHLEGSVIGGMVIPISDGDAAGWVALDGAPREGFEDEWREVYLFQLSEDVQVLLGSPSQ